MKTKDLAEGVAKLKTQLAKATKKASDTGTDPTVRGLTKMLKRKQRRIRKAQHAADCAQGKKKKSDD